MNIFDVAASKQWMITEEYLFTIMKIANRETGDLEAIATSLGRPLQNTRSVYVTDGVAVVPIVGPLFRRAGMLSDISGASSTEQVARDIAQALASDEVNAIILEIDSPGGEAAGVNEVGNIIYSARDKKPIVAYVGHQACSGGYWLASACSEVVIDRTAILGSIGVAVQYSKKKEDGPVSSGDIVSSQSPKKRLSPETDEGKQEIQTLVDSLADVFIETISRNRGVSVDKVLSDFGQGGSILGDAAVSRGMADRTGSLENLIKELSTNSSFRKNEKRKDDKSSYRMNEDRKLTIENDQITSEHISSNFPAIAEGFRAQGRAASEASFADMKREAVEGERNRISSIHAACIPGYETLASESISSGISAADFAYAQAVKMKSAGKDHLKALIEDDKTVKDIKTDASPIITVPDGKPKIDMSLPIEDRAKMVWDGSPDIRSEHGGNYKGFFAYYRAVETGQAKIFAGKA